MDSNARLKKLLFHLTQINKHMREFLYRNNHNDVVYQEEYALAHIRALAETAGIGNSSVDAYEDSLIELNAARVHMSHLAHGHVPTLGKEIFERVNPDAAKLIDGENLGEYAQRLGLNKRDAAYLRAHLDWQK